MSIEISELGFSYGGLPVLSEISFEIKPGEMVAVLGPNGSGKSTLLRVMAGLLPATSGSVRICGEDLSRLAPAGKAGLLGYLSQFHHAVFPFTCLEVVLTARAAFVYRKPGKKDLEISCRALEKLDIASLQDRPYTDISGGERQMVLLARLLAQQARVLLLDEPLTHLDPAGQAKLFPVLKELASSGHTVVCVLHDPGSALAYCERIIMLKNGRLFLPGTEKVNGEALRDLYGIMGTVPINNWNRPHFI